MTAKRFTLMFVLAAALLAGLVLAQPGSGQRASSAGRGAAFPDMWQMASKQNEKLDRVNEQLTELNQTTKALVELLRSGRAKVVIVPTAGGEIKITPGDKRDED